MSKSRQLADLLDSNGDVTTGALDNVPPSNDASALTTGTLDATRIADGSITDAKLSSTLDLSGKIVTLPAGTGGKVLQMTHTTAGVSTITHTSSYADVISASITPTEVGNKIIAIASMNFYIRAADSSYYGYGQYTWNKGGSDVGTAYQMYVANSSGHLQSQQNTMSYEWTVGAGEAGVSMTIKMRGKKETNTSATFLSNNYSPSHLILIEVAQ